MNRLLRPIAMTVLVAVSTTSIVLAAEPTGKLVPGTTFTITFPEMPPTFYDMAQKKDVKAQMAVFLPTNYSPTRKHPLLVFLGGGDGGTGSNPGVARAITAEKRFRLRLRCRSSR